jgi:hypothetical protein
MAVRNQDKEKSMIRKMLLMAGAAALMTTPAWAHPGNGEGHGPKGPPATTPNNKDNPGHKGGEHGHHGKSHKCTPHNVAYVASGTLGTKDTLEKNADGTYSGEVEVEVTHTNHHASADKGKTVVYSVKNVHVTFGLEDVNKDGSVGLDDLAKGDRVHVIGKITALAKKCDSSGFTATTTIRKLVFNAPAESKS